MHQLKLTIFLVTILIISAIISQSQSLITVKQDGTGNFTTIQEGVEYAANDDTVLVWPGIYYENVIIEDKHIVLGSLTLTTGNPQYINQTIINGNQSGSCMVIDNSSDTTVVWGLTLINGSGYNIGTLSGGGSHIRFSSVGMYECVIKNNNIMGSGGGLYIYQSNVYLSGVSINNNTAYMFGGGISTGKSVVIFDTNNLCSIYLNFAALGTDVSEGLGDSVLHIVVDTFTVKFPDYYYLYSTANGLLFNDITWQVNHGKIEQTEQDLFVSPQGDNENDGISAQTPLKDIWFALLKMKSDSISPDTIHILPGTYSPSTGEKYPLSLKGYASLKGTSMDACILNAEDEIYHMNSILNSCDFQISNLTINNGNGFTNTMFGRSSIIIDNSPFAGLKNLIITNNKSRISSIVVVNSNGFSVSNCNISENTGGVGMQIAHGGTATAYHTIKVTNCIIDNNIPDYSMPPNEGYLGGGIDILGPTPSGNSKRLDVQFYNCLFSKNRSRPHPAGSGPTPVSLSATNNSKAFLINCTFGDNIGEGSIGAGVGVTNSSELNIYNSILYHNDPAELYMYSLEGVNSLNIYSSLIDDGEDGVRIYTSGNNLNYDISNIDTDPLWDTTSLFPYSLSAGSPCIDAGTLDLPPGIELPETDLAGNPRVYNGYVDMGAYEYGPWVGIEEYSAECQVPSAEFLSVFPNPFRFETTISYVRPESGHCIINIYDLNGHCVKTMMNANGLSGNGEVRWRGVDDSGNPVPEGTYIVSIILNGKELEAKKVIKN